MKFDLKIFALLIFIWAILNLLNSVIFFIQPIPDWEVLIAIIRLLIGADALAMFLYLWKWADDMVILYKKKE